MKGYTIYELLEFLKWYVFHKILKHFQMKLTRIE